MKKILVIFLSVLLCLFLLACASENNHSNNDSDDEKNTSEDNIDGGVNQNNTEEVSETIDEEIFANHISSATVNKTDGSTVNSTAEELIEIFNNNQEHFNKYYTNAEISYNGVIKSIMKHQMTMINDDTWQVDNTVVIFEDGFCLVNPPQDLANYMPGDAVDVSGTIITATTQMMLHVHGPTKTDPTVWIDGSSLGILTAPNEDGVDVNSLSASELIDLFNNNQDRFNAYCTGKTITRTATISSILKNQMTMIGDETWEVDNTVVIFDDGFCLVNPPQELADYMPGDTVKFSGDIITATTHMMLHVHGPTKSEPTVWVDGSSYGIIG